MPYPERPVLKVLPQFRGSATIRQTAFQRAELLSYAAREYESGRSLRELAELTGRSQTAVRRALAQAGVRRRGPGARRIRDS